MTTPLLAVATGSSVPRPVKKKRILLIDPSPSKCELRATAMRKLGIDVDCAADIFEAQSWWRNDLYDLVLFSAQHDTPRLESFCEILRGAKPTQSFAFLIGKPRYLANLPEPVMVESQEEISAAEKTAALSGELGEVGHRWGILECSRLISAARSACNERMKAMQSRPAPIRDSEKRVAKRSPSSASRVITN